MMLGEAIDPVLGAAQRNRQRNLHRQASAVFRGCHFRPREEGDVRAGMPFPIGVKKVIRSWRILVYALLDQAHAKDTGIKVDVVLSVARNAGYVVESGYACHGSMAARLLSDCYVV